MKDALGHGSNSWSRLSGSKIKEKYISHNGNPNAIVRTEPSRDGNHVWQHEKEFGFAGSTDSAKRMVEDRVAAASLASGSKSSPAPVHDGMQSASRAFSDQTSVMRAQKVARDAKTADNVAFKARAAQFHKNMDDPNR